MPMPMRIVAFAIGPAVVRFVQRRVMEPMRGGELEFLTELNHRILPCTNRNSLEGGKAEGNLFERQRRPGFFETIENFDDRSFGRGPRRNSAGNDGHRELSRCTGDLLDVDQVAAGFFKSACYGHL